MHLRSQYEDFCLRAAQDNLVSCWGGMRATHALNSIKQTPTYLKWMEDNKTDSNTEVAGIERHVHRSPLALRGSRRSFALKFKISNIHTKSHESNRLRAESADGCRERKTSHRIDTIVDKLIAFSTFYGTPSNHSRSFASLNHDELATLARETNV